MKYIIDGIDFLGKNLLIDGILQEKGYHQVIHFTKPVLSKPYIKGDLSTNNSNVFKIKQEALKEYQLASIHDFFYTLYYTKTKIIANRSHLGECCYAPLYRGYNGDYVFDLEREFKLNTISDLLLILLTEDFNKSKHFKDDGLNLGPIEAREQEQNLHLAAFERSIIADKRLICVTNKNGDFKLKEEILQEALSNKV